MWLGCSTADTAVSSNTIILFSNIVCARQALSCNSHGKAKMLALHPTQLLAWHSSKVSPHDNSGFSMGARGTSPPPSTTIGIQLTTCNSKPGNHKRCATHSKRSHSTTGASQLQTTAPKCPICRTFSSAPHPFQPYKHQSSLKCASVLLAEHATAQAHPVRGHRAV